MSLQATTGPGSLVALGISVSDVATVYGLARRVGNWLTAASGDQILLDLLDQDEMDIIRRRGLIDILRFNKVWGSTMRLLVNGVPRFFQGNDAEKNLDRFSRFTATMVCTVAALGAFVPNDIVKSVLRKTLVELLRASEFGEDVLASQYTNRVNSWQSAADIRGLSSRAREIRQDLVGRGCILGGLMPIGDSPLMVHFLVWLLSDNTATYVTPSSDVAGVGACLAELGIDILSVHGLGDDPGNTPCNLEYSSSAILRSSISDSAVQVSDVLSRIPLTTVNLRNPEESLTKFPVDLRTSNRCRHAWTAGHKAAQYVGHSPLPFGKPGQGLPSGYDLHYVFYDKGHEPVRTRTSIGALAEAHAWVVNRELCQGLETELQSESDETLDWLLDQTMEASMTITHVWNPKFEDVNKINAFTVFQAFFMGYYYGIFGDLADTSTLQLQVVDGCWGYRSSQFLCNIRTLYFDPDRPREPGCFVMRREDIIGIISTLFCGNHKIITRMIRDTYRTDNWCLGVIAQRALLVRSLLKPCRTMEEVGQLVILDVDVSGIPTDSHGLVRPGYTDRSELHVDSRNFYSGTAITHNISETLTEDVTFHIEADWDGNPEEFLLCVRYKGRRINTINPAIADLAFCTFLVAPVPNPLPVCEIAKKDWSGQDCLNRGDLLRSDPEVPYIMCVPGRPRLRYAAVYWYQESHVVRLASNCLQSAIKQAKQDSRMKIRKNSCLVITGDEEPFSRHTSIPTEVIEKADKLIPKRKRTYPPFHQFL